MLLWKRSSKKLARIEKKLCTFLSKNDLNPQSIQESILLIEHYISYYSNLEKEKHIYLWQEFKSP